MPQLLNTGAVVIGRNEGERLHRCLSSLCSEARGELGSAHPVAAPDRVGTVIYVDSGSTDGSVALARELGAHVVELDKKVPFTAARARNAGFEALVARAPQVEFVQFVDGDCEIVPGWLVAAERQLQARPKLAAICGRRRERKPDASVYNQLCDIEWDTPVGSAQACGGDAMMRVSAFKSVGGFNPTVIAGEEPELCVRLRAQGWLIERIDHEMTLHDAAMTRLGQWWRRSERAGYAYALGKHLHGRPPELHYVRDVRRIWLWGAAVPAAMTLGFVPSVGMSSLLSLGYAVSAYRCYRSVKDRGRARKLAATYAAFCTLGKFPELMGVLRFVRHRALGEVATLIEYK